MASSVISRTHVSRNSTLSCDTVPLTFSHARKYNSFGRVQEIFQLLEHEATLPLGRVSALF